MGGAFVEIGHDRPALLDIGRTKPREGDTIAVQIVEEASGSKAARVSARLALAGRTLVLLPDDGGVAISKRIADAAQPEVYFQNAVVSAQADYVYDAVYRLVEATGREHVGQNGPVRPDDGDGFTGDAVPWNNAPHPNNVEALQRYREEYEYDPSGNILEMTHTPLVGGLAGWTRGYQYAATSNRLSATTDGQGAFNLSYPHDAAGNITAMPHLTPTDGMVWNHRNELALVNKGNPVNERVAFTYDGSGQRVRKSVIEILQNGSERVKHERIYVGGLFETFREYDANGAVETERTTLHALDGTRRVAMVETKTRENGQDVQNPVPRTRYQLDNHLGSACVEVDENGVVLTYEEYHPFGTTAMTSCDSGPFEERVPARQPGRSLEFRPKDRGPGSDCAITLSVQPSVETAIISKVTITRRFF